MIAPCLWMEEDFFGTDETSRFDFGVQIDHADWPWE